MSDKLSRSTIRVIAAENGLEFAALRSRLRRKGSIYDALFDTTTRTISFPINGIDLTLAEWCHYLNISDSAIHRAAKRHQLTSLQELQLRFKQHPNLFPKHLLDPSHPRYHEVKIKT